MLITYSLEQEIDMVTCILCKGTGVSKAGNGSICTFCDGTGKVEKGKADHALKLKRDLAALIAEKKAAFERGEL